MNVTKAVSHFSIEEVKRRMDEASRPLYRKRWRIIYHALVDPQPAETIALHCGVAKDTVHKLISRYNRFGLVAIETPGKGGRKRFYLTIEQEKQFLLPFFERAAKGKLPPAPRSMQLMKLVLTDLSTKVLFIGFLPCMDGEK